MCTMKPIFVLRNLRTFSTNCFTFLFFKNRNSSGTDITMSTIQICFLTIFITESFPQYALLPPYPPDNLIYLHSQSTEVLQRPVVIASPNKRISCLVSFSLNCVGLWQPFSSFLKLLQFSRATVFWIFLFRSLTSLRENINLFLFRSRLHSTSPSSF